MQKTKRKKIGIFLGRLQPQHPGHEAMIKRIFRENDEVVLCVGSAQKFTSDNPNFERNPLLIHRRLKTLRAFLAAQDIQKPYTVVTAKDIEPDSAWPAYLKKRCHLTTDTTNTIYFADQIPEDYREGLKEVGFRVKFLDRKAFTFKIDEKTKHRVSSATEIRKLKKITE